MINPFLPRTSPRHAGEGGNLGARAAIAALALLLFAAPVAAQQAQRPEPTPLTIGYLELADDPRYEPNPAYARIELRPLGRPIVGAEVALEEAAMIGQVIGIDFRLERMAAESAEAAAALVADGVERGINFYVMDLPADAVAAVAEASADLPALFLNGTAPEDWLRGEGCRANVLHVMPSFAMQMDAMVQYLVTKGWDDILVLQGSRPDDAAMVEALQRAVDRFGGRIVAIKPFILSNDPREREQNNVALMTAGESYDVVFIADHDGEFGRYVPYTTNLPRPVVGTTGLEAHAWDWTWERHGAPQLNARFEDLADRHMTDLDWSIWAAVKALVQATLRAPSKDFAGISEYLRSEQLRVDAFKGNPSNFRPWDGQMRQPLLLATHNAVIERAPLAGFLHQTNDLDTLGPDQADSQCRM